MLPDHLPEVNSGIGERGLQRGEREEGGRKREKGREKGREGGREEKREGERERGREKGGKMRGGGNMRVPLDQLSAEQP